MALEAAQMRTWHLDLAEHQEGSARGDPCPGPVSLPERWSAAALVQQQPPNVVSVHSKG
jgi:hypothetical protein